MMFAKKTHSVADIRKCVQKIFDSKKCSSLRLKSIRNLIETLHSNDVKFIFKEYFSSIYDTIFEMCNFIENNVMQRVTKAYREDVATLLYMLEHLFLHQPEVIQYAWHVDRLAHIMCCLLHPSNTLRLRREAMRIYLIWFQIVGEHCTAQMYSLFAVLVPGLYPSPSVPHSAQPLSDFRASHSNLSNHYAVFDGAQPYLTPVTAELMPENITKLFLECLLDCMMSQIYRIEWRDTSRATSCFEFLFDNFKQFYVPLLFPLFDWSTDITSLVNTETVLCARRCCTQHVSQERQTTGHAQTSPRLAVVTAAAAPGGSCCDSNSLLPCQVAVIRWVASFVHMSHKFTSDSAASSSFESSSRHLGSAVSNMNIISLNTGADNCAASNASPSRRIERAASVDIIPSEAPRSLPLNLATESASSLYHHSNTVSTSANVYIVSNVLCTNRRNLNFVLELFRQAFLLDCAGLFVIKRAIFVYRYWIQNSGSVPTLFFEPSDDLAHSDSQDNSQVAVNQAGPQNLYRLFIAHSSHVFLLVMAPSCCPLYLQHHVEMCKRVLNLYRYMVMNVNLANCTWHQLLCALLQITKRTLTADAVNTCQLGPMMAKPMFQTLIVTWVKASLNITVSTELWDTLLSVLSTLTDWEELISEWAKTMDTLTRVLCRQLYGVDLFLSDSISCASNVTQQQNFAIATNFGLTHVPLCRSDADSCSHSSGVTARDHFTHLQTSYDRLSADNYDVNDMYSRDTDFARSETDSISFHTHTDSYSSDNVSYQHRNATCSIAASQSMEQADLDRDNYVEDEDDGSTVALDFVYPDSTSLVSYSSDCRSVLLGGAQRGWTPEAAYIIWRRLFAVLGNINSIHNSTTHLSALNYLNHLAAIFLKIEQCISLDYQTSRFFTQPLCHLNAWCQQACTQLLDRTHHMSTSSPHTHPPAAATTSLTPRCQVPAARSHQPHAGDTHTCLLAALRLCTRLLGSHTARHQLAPTFFHLARFPRSQEAAFGATTLLSGNTATQAVSGSADPHLLASLYVCLHVCLVGTHAQWVRAAAQQCACVAVRHLLPGVWLLRLDFVHSCALTPAAADTAVDCLVEPAHSPSVTRHSSIRSGLSTNHMLVGVSTHARDCSGLEGITLIASLVCLANTWTARSALKPHMDYVQVIDSINFKNTLLTFLLKYCRHETSVPGRCMGLHALAIFCCNELAHALYSEGIKESLCVFVSCLKCNNQCVAVTAANMLTLLTEHSSVIVHKCISVPIRLLEAISCCIEAQIMSDKGAVNSDTKHYIVSLLYCFTEWLLCLPAPILQSHRTVLTRFFDIIRLNSPPTLRSVVSSPAELHDTRSHLSSSNLSPFNFVSLALQHIVGHLHTHLGHYPLFEGTAHVCSSQCEGDCDASLCGDLLARDNIQFLVFNNECVLSLMETDMTADEQTSDCASFLQSRKVTIISRDTLGRSCWHVRVSPRQEPPPNQEATPAVTAASTNSQSRARDFKNLSAKFTDMTLTPSAADDPELCGRSAAPSMLRQRSRGVLPTYENTDASYDTLSDLFRYIDDTSTFDSFLKKECFQTDILPQILPQTTFLKYINRLQKQRHANFTRLSTVKFGRGLSSGCARHRPRPHATSTDVATPTHSQSTNQDEVCTSGSFLLARHLLCQLGMFSTSRDSPLRLLRRSDSMLRDLRHLDAQKVRDTHKIAVIYVASGQTDKASILSNCSGSELFEAFVSALGWEVDLRVHAGFMGGLSAGGTTGTSSVYYATSLLEIMFHVSTRIPHHTEDAVLLKTRHLGNDEVHIIWSEHHLDYHRDILPTQFADVIIVIYPIQSQQRCSNLFRIQIDKKPSVPIFGPLFDGAIIEGCVLPALVRATAVFASRVIRSKLPHYLHFFEERRQALNALIENHKCTCTFERFATALFFPGHHNSSKDTQFILSHDQNSLSCRKQHSISDMANISSPSPSNSEALEGAVSTQPPAELARGSLSDSSHSDGLSDTFARPSSASKRLSILTTIRKAQSTLQDSLHAKH